jgi:hypothetical protein
MNAVERVLAREFPDRTVADVTRSARGNRKRTRFVTFADGGRVVVQLSDEPDRLAVETRVARLVGERTDVPTPAVLAAGRVDGEGYLVTERAPGEDLHERFMTLAAAEREAVASAFGRWLAACHDAVAFDGYGPVTLDGKLVATTTDWRSWFDDYLTVGLDALPAGLADLRGEIEATVDATTVAWSPPARLFPWDLRPGNALYRSAGSGADPSGVTAVLDWGEPLAASPGLSAAKTEHLVCDWYVDDRAPLRRAFRDGYRERRAWPNPSRAERLAAVVRSAVDSRGVVTRPGYPERDGDEAVAFHRERLAALL